MFSQHLQAVMGIAHAQHHLALITLEVEEIGLQLC